MVGVAIVLNDHLSGRQKTGEVGQIVETGGAEVGEMTHFHTGHLQQGISTHLAEAKTAEGDALQADLVLANIEVHHELLGYRLITSTADQPELVAASTTIEGGRAGSFKDGEDVVTVATEGAVTCGADEEIVVSAITAEAVAIAGGGPDLIVAGTAGDHIAAARIDHVASRTGEDRVTEAVVQFAVHHVGARSSENSVRLEGELLGWIGNLEQVLAAGESDRGAHNSVLGCHETLFWGDATQQARLHDQGHVGLVNHARNTVDHGAVGLNSCANKLINQHAIGTLVINGYWALGMGRPKIAKAGGAILQLAFCAPEVPNLLSVSSLPFSG